MAKTIEEAFNIFIDRLIPTANERSKAASHRQTIYSKLDSTFGLYRMFESGSFKHGTSITGRSDVDYFVSLKTSQPTYASSTLNAVRDALKERFPYTRIYTLRGQQLSLSLAKATNELRSFLPMPISQPMMG